MSFEWVVFGVSAIVAVLGATMMIVQRNPVASVLYLILSLVAQAVLYVQLGGLFLGAVLIMVYAGAILVLFLFVIMLLNLRGGEDLGKPAPVMSTFAKYLVSLLFLVELVFIIRQSVTDKLPAAVAAAGSLDFASVEAVSMRLFKEYLYPFELTGVLLLVAVVGAVVIAKKEDKSDKAPDGDSGATPSEKTADEMVG